MKPIKRALIIRHHAAETLAENYTSILQDQGFELAPVNVFDAEPFYDRFLPPALNEADIIISLGGPMSANDDYPLKVCVVSGEKLGGMGEPYVHLHEGTTVKFCCKPCLKKFNEDPDRYLAKLAQ